MSIGSFFKSILDGILSVFKSMSPQMKEAVKVGNLITDAIKTVDPNDDNALAYILQYVPKELHDKAIENIVQVLFDAKLITTTDITPVSAIKAAAAHIKEMEGKLTHKVSLNNVAIFLTDVFADGKITWKDLFALPKLFHDNRDEINAQD